MDFRQNQNPDLVFIGKCPNTYTGGLKLNVFTEDLEIYKLFESSEVLKNSLINDIKKIDDLTLEIVGKKSSSLYYDSTRENPEFVLTEIAEGKE